MIGLGVRFRPGSEFRDRAARILSSFAMPTHTLAHHLFRLRQVPEPLADRLVRQVLQDDPEFRCDGDGFWRYTPPGAWSPTVRLQELTYCVVDVETTGGAPWNGHRVIEVAAVMLRGGAVVNRFVTLVNPDRSIPPFVRELTGITNAMVAEAPRFAEIAPALQAFLSGSVFVGHNAVYDWRFLDAEHDRAAGLRMEGTRLCTLRLARRLYPELESRNLGALAEHFGVPLLSRHRAGDDAGATALLFVRFLDRLGELGVTNWATLQDFLTRRRESRGHADAARASDSEP